jgi:hypothetical protein
MVGQPYLVAEAPGSVNVVTDQYRYKHFDAGVKFYSGANQTGNVYYGYDSTAGIWKTPIYTDVDSQVPTGKIFEIFPKLRFTGIVSVKEILPESALDVLAFFGGVSDFSIENFVKQWLMMVRARARLTGEFVGASYRVGDTVKRPVGIYGAEILPGEKLIIERAQIKQESSVLEMVTL